MRRELIGVVAVLGLAACDEELDEAECHKLGNDYHLLVVSPIGTDQYVLTSNGKYTAMHTSADGTPVSCSSVVSSCSSGDVDTIDLRKVFGNAEVKDAFANSASYGSGVEFTIERDDGERVQLGGGCNGQAGCVDAPAGLTALREKLANLIEQQELACETTDIDAGLADAAADDAAVVDACGLDQDYRVYFTDALDGGLSTAQDQLWIAADGAVRLDGPSFTCTAQLALCADGTAALGDVSSVVNASELQSAFASGLTYGTPDSNLYYVIERADGRRVRIGVCQQPDCLGFSSSISEARELLDSISANTPIGPLLDGGLAGSCR